MIFFFTCKAEEECTLRPRWERRHRRLQGDASHKKLGLEAWACYSKKTCPLVNQLTAKPDSNQPN